MIGSVRRFDSYAFLKEALGHLGAGAGAAVSAEATQ